MNNNTDIGNLILSAKAGSVVWVGYDVKLTVLSVDRDNGEIKLSFVAPKDTPIDRDSVRRNKRIRDYLCLNKKE
jgi:carbon storage regulator CsrA